MADQPYMSMVEVVSLILDAHPDGMTLNEIQDHPLWGQVDGSWKRGAIGLIFGPAPALHRILEALDSKIAMASGAEPIARSSNSFLPSRGRWVPTTRAKHVAEAVRPKLTGGSQ